MRLFAIVVSSIGASALSCWVIAQIAKCISQWWAWRTIEQAARKTPIPPAPRVPSIRVRDYSIPVEREHGPYAKAWNQSGDDNSEGPKAA